MDGEEDLHLILKLAKPVQMRLKEWYTTLPAELHLGNTRVRKLCSVGYLHLGKPFLLSETEYYADNSSNVAYFATEITLHRRIVRALSPTTTDPEILRICRTAAEARFISTMDFAKRLRPEHLQSFWYFASSVNLAIVGTFGCLLWATALDDAESQLYRRRLEEYQWTLRVSSKGAEFMGLAVDSMNQNMEILDRPRARTSPERNTYALRGAPANPASNTTAAVGDEIDYFKLGNGNGNGNADNGARPTAAGEQVAPPPPDQHRSFILDNGDLMSPVSWDLPAGPGKHIYGDEDDEELYSLLMSPFDTEPDLEPSGVVVADG